MFSIFNKNIFPNNEINNNLITPHKLRGGKVNINATVDIPTGFCFVIVIDGKIADVVGAGRHKVNGANMPGSFDKLRLGRANRRGKMQKKFKARVYYVNLKTFVNFEYQSNTPFHVRSDIFGRIKGYGEGVCTISIKDAEEVMKNLLKKVNIINSKFAEVELGITIGNLVNKLIEKSKVGFTDILLKPDELNKFLNPALNNMLSEVGFEVDDVRLVSLRLNKKAQRKVNEFLTGGVDVNFDGQSLMLKNTEEVLVTTQSDGTLAGDYNQVITQNTTPDNGALLSDADSHDEHKKHSFDFDNQEQNSNEIAHSEIQDKNVSGILNKRMSDANLINAQLNVSQNNYQKPVLNANEVLKDDTNELKVCKFCGQTIDLSYKYCPKCGFKQQ